MKRIIFITVGGILLLLVFSLWIYLLLFGAPQQVSDVFTNFGLGQTTERSETPLDLGNTSQLNLNAGSLVQLTTRPVANAAFLITGSSTTALRYAEKGTGHIYEIDISSGLEKRVHAKTLRAVINAVFAPSGERAVLIAEAETGTTASLEALTSEAGGFQLPASAANVHFSSDNELRYTVHGEDVTSGYAYDFTDLEQTKLFTAPFSDMSVWWGEGETLIQNRTAPRLMGGLYRIGNQLTRIGRSGYAFSAMASRQFPGTYVMTAYDPASNSLRSHLWQTETGETRLPIVLLPDKCVFDPVVALIAWCAAPVEDLNRTAQTDWYKGSLSFIDMLWRIDLQAASAQVIDDLSATAGRNLDVIDLQIDPNGSYLLFKNKTDDTLWLKKLSVGS